MALSLTVITINRNNANGLLTTLESVGNMLIPDGLQLEHLIIDGASTDASISHIRAYAEAAHPYTVRWQSEPDAGIYNAINKGIQLATGDYIQVLNSGDSYAANDAIWLFYEAFVRAGAPEMLYGNMLRIRPDGSVQNKSTQVPDSLLQYYGSTMNHNCCWIRKTLFTTYGLYDEQLRIVSDWKWFLQAIGLGQLRPVYADVDLTRFDLTGISESQLDLRNRERREVLTALLPPALLADLDQYAFPIEQVNRLRKHHLYPLFSFIERVLAKLEKWHIIR